MANSRSAWKRVRTNARRRAMNKSVSSRTKTALKRFETTAATGEADVAIESFRAATSTLDRAAKSGVVHPNKAARKKSRMAKRLAKLV